MKDLVNGLKKNCERGFNFLFRQIDEAPDAVWGSKGGNIYYWQHVYHAFYCAELFILQPGETVDPGPGTADIAMFHEFPDKPLSKDAVREYGKKKQAQVYAWVDSLEDADLAKKNEGNSARRKMDVSNGAVIDSLGGHLMYHVGCNDTKLRENGQEGVY